MSASAEADLSEEERAGLELVRETGGIYQSEFWKALDVSSRKGSRIVESLLADGEPKSHLAGVEVRWDSTHASGQRVRDIRIRNGGRIDSGRRYTLAVPDFLLGAQDEFAPLAGLPAEPGGVLDVDALVRYLGALSQPVEPPAYQAFIPSR